MDSPAEREGSSTPALDPAFDSSALQPKSWTEKLVRNPLVLISPFFLWGSSMVAMKDALVETTPLFIASVRLIPAGLLVVAFAMLIGREQPKGGKAWLWISLFALVDGTLFQGFLAKGLDRTGAGLGSVMIDSQPLAVAVMARFLFKEWIGPLGWIGLLVGLAGISCIGLPDRWILAALDGKIPAIAIEQEVWSVLFRHGEWLMLMAALSMAVGTILIRYVAAVADPVMATGWHMVLGGLPLLVLSQFEDSTAWQGLSLLGWAEMGYATILGSAIAYGVFFYLATQGSLTSLSALTFLTPVFALLFSTWLLAESLSLVQWSGVILTLVSIYIINRRVQIASWLSNQLAALSFVSPPASPSAAVAESVLKKEIEQEN